MAGLFGILNIGKSGLFGQQEAINVTSHNISNANTPGYTRQRAELQASLPASVTPGQMGTGVDVVDIKRIRNSFLDSGIRSQNGAVGKYNGLDTFLSQVEDILNEPSDDSGLSVLLGKFFDAWNTLGTHADNYDSKSLVAKTAVSAADNLNQMSAKLTQLKENSQKLIQESVVNNVNNVLDEINKLNQQIRQVEVTHQNPNDLMDKRDLLLDNLSKEFGISIDSREYGSINLTTSNENDSSENNYDGNPPVKSGKNVNLVEADDPDGGARFAYINDIKPAADGQTAGDAGDYIVTYYKNGDVSLEANKVTITVTIKDTGKPGDKDYVSAADNYKKLDHSRVIWTDRKTGAVLKKDGSPAAGGDTVNFKDLSLFQPPLGNLNGYIQAQEHIDEYQRELDNEAKALAFAVNGIISQSSTAVGDTSTNINNFFVNSSMESVYTETGADALKKIDEAEKGITAANIAVNRGIIDDPNLIKTAAQYDTDGNRIGAEGDGTRATAVEMLRDQRMPISSIGSSTDKESFLKDIFVQDSTIGSAPIYTVRGNQTGMTVDTYFRTTVTKLGKEEDAVRRGISSSSDILNHSIEKRNSTSGVSLDEEMTNLIQFQHCYQANAKIIATVDQLLDVVVNGLKK